MDAWMWAVLIGVLVVFYILLIVRQKRQEKRNIEALNQFKVGDKVVTHIGIYGKIKKIYNTTFGKVCVLEIGVANKIDIELDLRYVAALDEKVFAPDEPVKTEDKKIDNNTNENKVENKK